MSPSDTDPNNHITPLPQIEFSLNFTEFTDKMNEDKTKRIFDPTVSFDIFLRRHHVTYM